MATPCASPVSACESRRQVEREHRQSRPVDPFDAIAPRALDGPVDAGSEQGIDDEFRAGERRRLECAMPAALGGEVLVRLARIAAQSRRIGERGHADFEARRAREAREHVAVAAVVSGTAEDRELCPAGPVPAHGVERRSARALHQLVARNARLLDRVPVHGPHLGGRIDLGGQRVHRRDYTGRPASPALPWQAHSPTANSPRSAGASMPLRASSASTRSASPASSLPEDEANLERWIAERRHGGMDYMERHGQRRSRPDELVPGTHPRDQRAHGGQRAGCAARIGSPRGRAQGFRRALCARARLPQGAAQAARRARDPPRIGDRPLRLSRVRGFRAGDGKAAGAQRGARLDRQAHEPHQRARRIPVHARRAADGPAAARRRALARSLRQLQRLPAGLPDRRDHRALPARRAALHLLPDDRTPRLDSRRRFEPRSATGSSAATTASSSVPGTSSRASRPSPISASATDSTRRISSSSSAGRKRTTTSAAPAARCAGSAFAAGSGTSPSRSAMRRARKRPPPRSPSAATTPIPSSANTCAGRSRARNSGPHRIDVVPAARGLADRVEQVVEIA